jgi:hypothetical protein
MRVSVVVPDPLGFPAGIHAGTCISQLMPGLGPLVLPLPALEKSRMHAPILISVGMFWNKDALPSENVTADVDTI